MTDTYIEAQGYVEDSAKVLDKYVEGWWRRIETLGLTIESADNCMLQQLYGDYSTGMAELEQKVGYAGMPSLQGFYCDAQEDPMFVKAWKAEIRKRNKADEEYAEQLSHEAQVKEERELVLATR